MSTRGRKPTPSHLKLVEGNPGKRPIPVAKQKRAAGSRSDDGPRLPKKCQPEVAIVWRRAIKNAPRGVLQACDADIFYQWCLHRHLLEKYERNLHLSPALVKNKAGDPVPSPWSAMVHRESEMCRKLVAEIGFSPATRVRLGAERNDEALDDDASDHFD